VRARLRSLGYLDGPLERFVLAGALGSASPWRQALSTSFRVALIGGPLLGAGIAAGALAVSGPPLTDAGSALLLALYLTLPCFAGLFLLELATAGLLSLIGARGGAASIPVRQAVAARGGLALAVVFAGYLALWWRNRAAAAIAPAGAGATIAVLGLFLLITTLLWRVTSIATLAALIARSGRLPAARRTSAWRSSVYPALAGALLLILALWGAGRRTDERPVVTPRAAPGPVIMTGVDGLDIGLARAVAQRCREGALHGAGCEVVADLEHARPWGQGDELAASPPVLWTSIATGLRPDQHGVHGLETETVAGVRAPLPAGAGFLPLDAALEFLLPTRTGAVSAEGRRGRAVWEILGERAPVAVAGWWATMPALPESPDTSREVIVSDQTLHALVRGNPSGLETWPASLYDRFAPLLEETRTEETHALDSWIAAQAAVPGAWVPGERARRLAIESLLVDGFFARVTRTLAAAPGVAGVFSYYPGLDILLERLDADRDPAAGASPEETIRMTSLWLDLRAGDLLSAKFPPVPAGSTGALRIRLFAPGRRPGAQGGWMLLSGPDVSPEGGGAPLAACDLAPTLLAWTGYPAPLDAAGAVRLDLFTPEGKARLQASGTIPGYGRRKVSLPESQSEGYQEEMLDRLRSLGYVR